ncbi:hypothetical protein FB559_1478 [Actinoallomurus bryophytorum]|uniref:Uncharacterized protein n=1 Tax=Actinoallomurus bryophytorum TaxID=1490222 RepID=A0A543CFS3_9ACTN|nr:hypothetical protein [Actinoallomurus bryophytorum]TQL95963.1 hypothetical protein FB559_1478 [Actinoallomurus bryophytorum]
MSSAVLYLAIVAVWGIVLVPMWLRRDGEGIGRLLHRRQETADDAVVDEDEDDDAFEEPGEGEYAEPAQAPPAAGRVESGRGERGRVESGRGESGRVESVRRRRVTRGAVIARRRRRTLGLSLLTLTAIAVTAFQVAPWWFVIPPVVLLGGHLSLLRVAVSMDHARRAERRRVNAIRAAQARHIRAEREAQEAAEAATRTAEVIELPGWQEEEVYDQYTDLRAVGD